MNLPIPTRVTESPLDNGRIELGGVEYARSIDAIQRYILVPTEAGDKYERVWSLEVELEEHWYTKKNFITWTNVF